MNKLVQHLNIIIATVNGVRGFNSSSVSIAELLKDPKGNWVAIDGTAEKLPISVSGELQGHYTYNDTEVPIDLLSHVQAINESLQRTLSVPPTKVINYQGQPHEKITYELRPTDGITCQQPDGQMLRLWPIWVSDTINNKDPSTMSVRIFGQYAAAVKRLGFL